MAAMVVIQWQYMVFAMVVWNIVVMSTRIQVPQLVCSSAADKVESLGACFSLCSGAFALLRVSGRCWLRECHWKGFALKL